MANRRMFAKSIIQSARFLMMPPTSRLLYFDLGIAADDDGIAEAFTVMRMTNAAEDDLKLLAAKGFVKILNDELVTVILDWKVHNYIQPDRYTPSVYKELLQQNVMDTSCTQPVYNVDTACTQNVYNVDTACTQNVYNVDTACIQDGYTGKVRVRDSIEKSSRGEDRQAAAQSSNKILFEIPTTDGSKYGITQEQVDRWSELYPDTDVSQSIRNIIGFLEGKHSSVMTNTVEQYVNRWISGDQKTGKCPRKDDAHDAGYWEQFGEEAF